MDLAQWQAIAVTTGASPPGYSLVVSFLLALAGLPGLLHALLTSFPLHISYQQVTMQALCQQILYVKSALYIR
ncbi:hypothetical protein RNAN_1387 [Rheinheimera nanhaiensis E407-8]|uniref:Uncharacterized protein n=1 Tax=Rheinheimera nanhaiensis E407-8 TaxID=562729 RepID=I1DWI7_9GAMM|nr:hypothetical protein RNAN_1387 [Rheinheimera nanhaiensis E407-8]